MMVALGAFKPDAQKQLADQGAHFVRAAAITEQGCRTVLPGAAFGRDQATNKRVIGNVVAELLADPIVVIEDGFDTDAIGIRTKQVCPVASPMVGILRTLEQAINQLGPF